MLDQTIISDAENQMKKTVASWTHQLSLMRTGRANPNMLNGVYVDYYGTMTPLNQTAQISAPEPQLILIKPYDRSVIPNIVNGINKADLGLNPIPDAEVVRINVPALTEEIRKDLVKRMNKDLEAYRIQIRNERRNAIELANNSPEVMSEDRVKGIEREIQMLTDKYIKELDELAKNKAQELMTV